MTARDFLYPWQINGHASTCLCDRCDLPWQRAEIERWVESKRGIFAQPRCGKTRAAAKALARAVAAREYRRVVIVAPKRVCSMWADFLDSMPELAALGIMRGFRVSAVKLGTFLRTSTESGIVIVSQDAIGRSLTKYTRLVDALLKWDPQAYIRDESHNDANAQSLRSKASQKIAKHASWYRALTGTPVPNHFGNLWPQLGVCDPEAWGASYTKFADKFLIRDNMFPSRIIGHVNTDELQRMILRCATTARREEIFGPDMFVPVVRTIDLPPKAQQHYDRVVNDWILSRRLGDDVDLTADHTLTRLVRLQQIAAGYITDEDGTDIVIHDAKIDAVLADLDEIVEQGEKAVVFHRFTWEGTQYAQRIQAEFPGVPVWSINGQTSSTEADRIWKTQFPQHQGSAIVVVQVRSGGIGISFAEAQHALFVSLGFSFANEFEQPRDRIYKAGHTRTVTHYAMRGTVDEYIHATIDSKRNVHDNVMKIAIEELAYGRFYRPRMKKGKPTL